ncbi:MAG: nucleotidyltransferase domain-containing protein [Promethearchaeota archaeon]
MNILNLISNHKKPPRFKMDANNLKLRDRDDIITKEGIIFRVLGYQHPPDGWICEPIYAPKSIFSSGNPRSPRGFPETTHYKFYEDEGMTWVWNNYPFYRVYNNPLQTELIGVKKDQIANIRKTDDGLKKLIYKRKTGDILAQKTLEILEFVLDESKLRIDDFGIFGSLLHGFYHPYLSDIDFVVYGRNSLSKLLATLDDLYSKETGNIVLRNEFDGFHKTYINQKNWRFKNISLDEYVFHERRKLIWASCIDSTTNQEIKIEFEPVRTFDEIENEYSNTKKITSLGWVVVKGEVIEEDAYFMPSLYDIDIEEIIEGKIPGNKIERVISYVEEFRGQAQIGDRVLIAGNLEKVEMKSREFYQIILTFCGRYFDQVIKLL